MKRFFYRGVFSSRASAMLFAGIAAFANARPASAQTAPAATNNTPPRTARNSNARNEEGTLLRFTIPGEFQGRFNMLTAQPLLTTPGQTEPSTLGQQLYAEMWFRFRPVFSVGERFRVVGQFDVARGIVVGDSTREVELSRDPRSTALSQFTFGVFDLRHLYVDWTTPVGVLRAGLMGSHWGMGIVANDGDHANTFGDYRLGDLVFRLAFATRPFGRESDVVVALAGDLVYRDRLTRLVEYQIPVPGSYEATGRSTVPLGNDRAWQGIFSVFYQHHSCTDDCERKRVGVYLVYRHQNNRVGDPLYQNDYLRILFADALARWEWPSPDGRSRVHAAIEVAGLIGRTTLARNIAFNEQDVIQAGAALEVGITRPQSFRLNLEAGYASGDSNPTDNAQRRFTFNPDHRVGLLLFPEVIAWQTARSAAIATDPRIINRPTRGAELLPSSGGVTNAAYLYPTAVIDLHRWVDVRFGAVYAVSTTDVVDPAQVTTLGVARNYRGGNPANRDLGLELDAGVMARFPIAFGIQLNVGMQGAVLFPGHAFDDAMGNPMPIQGTGRAMLGVSY